MSVDVANIDEPDAVKAADKRETDFVVEDQYGIAALGQTVESDRTDAVLFKTPDGRAATGEKALAERNFLPRQARSSPTRTPVAYTKRGRST